MNGYTDSSVQTQNMTQSNNFASPNKRERTVNSNPHSFSLSPNISPRTIEHPSQTSLPTNLMNSLPNVVETAAVPNFQYKPTCIIRETHSQSVFGVAFNSVNRSQPTDPLLFATVASHYVTVYQCSLKNDLEDKSTQSSDMSSVCLLQSFADPAGDKEEFYCCAWSRDTSGNVASSWWTDCCESRRPRPTLHPHQGPISSSSGSLLPAHQQVVAAAGKRGVIRILCPSMASCPASLVGHGSSINELRFHPRDPALLFSFSKDYTIRLWNIASHVLVCIFGGAEGHRAEVLHGDLSLTGDLLLSAGMDHCVKIWRLNTPELANAVIDSFNYRSRSNPKPFPVLVQHFPEFSSRDVHGNYVDCARWFGSLVISKSCENSVTLWKPGGLDDSSANIPTPGVPTEHKTSIIHQLKATDCNLWYIRFDIDLKNHVLALGTGTGPSRVYLWDLKYPENALNLPAQVLHFPTVSGVGPGGMPLSHSAIRQTRFADDGDILLCVGDNGLIVRFDKI
ncbi:putative embryonic ectoderm development protein [Schistosoma mansoni]|uniref:putative embryonic ectoderm development protein n=1 Tax=Schistosoma mansoni TaxID=6183 RepID=UPI0001A62C0B|nr:putative embryonic ectoderm development protein [Schistosoma mansoni]|eukprot:XP_018654559.1 putative embryonic ectoderm development protein [Schistosoma mansoni]